ncbi:(2Fe-2S) ferredoxin domain-containing protein [Saccharococcus caldoxylosilyticus]|uniref:Putative 2Fe-2S ferredoxin n=1 Tax=Parageobacillus caldoxylosilyticus NBRC 107762 TaxID=1220594 RepID=A0A023DDC9_9BACL|nr:(2Fe-2S) ferredoxin domain-containing protein [Parageobacillus caldoxylosilyticus]MBB3852494.1 (2Fe-2S) ferredoxin [Parageobacillus caldoxylosilyticus]GAJ39162.1 putative 2Fe-2S ferredoxin [Parageobacillus caldoxylosilyticus NBRC 107762]
MATWNLIGMKHHVLICNGGSCMRKGGEEVTLAIREEIARLELDDIVHTTRTRCNGRCEDACVVIVYPEGIWYKAMNAEKGRELVQKHLRDSQLLEEAMTYYYREGKGLIRSATSNSLIGISKSEKRGR